MTAHMFRLMEAHQRVDEELRQESGRRWPDAFRIMRLKKFKLHLKDRLNGFMARRLGAQR